MTKKTTRTTLRNYNCAMTIEEEQRDFYIRAITYTGIDMVPLAGSLVLELRSEKDWEFLVRASTQSSSVAVLQLEATTASTIEDSSAQAPRSVTIRECFFDIDPCFGTGYDSAVPATQLTFMIRTRTDTRR